jgi:hypothetical protein
LIICHSAAMDIQMPPVMDFIQILQGDTWRFYFDTKHFAIKLYDLFEAAS